MNIGCAILAGGKSSRMGTDKALLNIHGKDFLSRLTDELSVFEERIISLGSGSQCLPENRRWTAVFDLYPDHGPIGGLHAALSACRSDALLFVTCDMPLFQYSLAQLLCCEMNMRPCDAVVSVTADGRIHPLCGVYRKSALPILENQIVSGQNKMMKLLDRLHVTYVPLPHSLEIQVLNINTPEDYQNLSAPLPPDSYAVDSPLQAVSDVPPKSAH